MYLSLITGGLVAYQRSYPLLYFRIRPYSSLWFVKSTFTCNIRFHIQCTAGPCNTGGPWTTSIFSTPSGYFVLKFCTYIDHRKINKPWFFGIFICLHTQVNAVYALKLPERGNRCIWRFNILIWPIMIYIKLPHICSVCIYCYTLEKKRSQYMKNWRDSRANE